MKIKYKKINESKITFFHLFPIITMIKTSISKTIYIGWLFFTFKIRL